MSSRISNFFDLHDSTHTWKWGHTSKAHSITFLYLLILLMVEFHRLQVPLDCHSCGFMKKLSVTCGGASCTQEISLAKSLDAHVIKNIFTVSIGFDAFCLPSNTSFCCAMHPSSHSLM